MAHGSSLNKQSAFYYRCCCRYRTPTAQIWQRMLSAGCNVSTRTLGNCRMGQVVSAPRISQTSKITIRHRALLADVNCGSEQLSLSLDCIRAGFHMSWMMSKTSVCLSYCQSDCLNSISCFKSEMVHTIWRTKSVFMDSHHCPCSCMCAI